MIKIFEKLNEWINLIQFNYELSKFIGSPVSLLVRFATALKIHEGWYKGSRSYRNNSPGNFRYTKFVGTTLGAIGQDKQGFAIFKDYNSGFQALMKFITMAAQGRLNLTPYRPETTILQFFQIYAPAEDKNNPVLYAKIVGKSLGVDEKTFQIKNLL